MRSPSALKWLRRAVLFCVCIAALGYLFREPLFFALLYRGTRADWQLSQLIREQEVTSRELVQFTRDGQKDSKRQELLAKDQECLKQLLALSEEHRRTLAGLGAQYFIAGTWPSESAAQNALQMLLDDAKTADLDALGNMFERIGPDHRDALQPLIPVLVERAKAQPDHVHSATLLVRAIVLAAPGSDETSASPLFVEIADLIAEQHASSPKLSNFCEVLGRGDYSAPWAVPFESHLRRILASNRDRFVRSSASIALANVVQAGGESRQSEAEQLFERYLAEFDGKFDYPALGIEQSNRRSAQRQLKEIRSHGLGKPAPETSGSDLAGEPLWLADFRGKVLLVSFWASWCSPCLRLVPHERELVDQFDPKKFAIVGVNSDAHLNDARDAVEKHQIPWRSFQNSPGKPEIANRWNVVGYPTLYLLDSEGIVRRRWIGTPPPADLRTSIEQLLGKEK